MFAVVTAYIVIALYQVMLPFCPFALLPFCPFPFCLCPYFKRAKRAKKAKRAKRAKIRAKAQTNRMPEYFPYFYSTA